MQRLCIFFLLCIATFSACRSKENAILFIYCNETFWYVMQEEAIYFSQISGIRVRLLPICAEQTPRKTGDAVEIGAERLTVAPWRSKPKEQGDSASMALYTQIHPGIAQQIERIDEDHFGDMFLTDSPKHVEKLRNIALSMKEYPVCYLTLTMLVPEGNPRQLTSVKDVIDSNKKLGIMNPAFDGLGEASWAVLTKIVPGGESAIPMERVKLYERQYDLMEALELGNIDAALVWSPACQLHFLLIKYADEYNATWEKTLQEAQRKKDREEIRLILDAIYEDIVADKSFAEEVPLTKNPEERHVAEVPLIALSSSLNLGYCERFADYMKSNRSKEILQRFGFVTK